MLIYMYSYIYIYTYAYYMYVCMYILILYTYPSIVLYEKQCIYFLSENLALRINFYAFKFFLFLFIYSHVHTLFGSFLHLASLTPFSRLPPHFQEGPVLPLSLILLKKRHKHNKEDKVFAS
jgi:hypothetical protein